MPTKSSGNFSCYNSRYISTNPSKNNVVSFNTTNIYTKLKNIGKQYGAVFVATYWSIWAIILGSTYALAKHNIIDENTLYLPQILAFVNKKIINPIGNFTGTDLTKYYLSLDNVSDNSKAFITAFLFAKVTKPLYLPLSVYLSPIIKKIVSSNQQLR